MPGLCVEETKLIHIIYYARVSERGLCISSISLTRELVRNENDQALPQTYCVINVEVGDSDLCNKPFRFVTLEFENHCSRSGGFPLPVCHGSLGSLMKPVDTSLESCFNA